MKSIKDQVNARTIEFKSDNEIIAEVTKSTNQDHESEIIRQEVADKERWKKAAEEAKLAKQQSKLANERAARVELVLDKFMSHYKPTTNTSSSFPGLRIPNDEEYGDDQDGNDEDGNGNNEDGNGNNEPTSSSDDE
ncbi:hypothetical protein Tco_0143353 [Tanacetum coccineum]